MTRLLPTDEEHLRAPTMTSVEPTLRAAADHAIDWLAEIDR